MDSPKLLATAEGRNSGAFTPTDWGLLLVPAALFGASFLLMAIILDDMAPGVVSFGRIAFGFAALSIVPGARAPIDRADWGRLILLGCAWMGVPLTLFPIAQQYVSSAIAGMINGGTPLMVGLVATVLLRRLPGRRQLLGVITGLVGIVLISLPSLGNGSDSVLGVGLILAAIAGYGLAFNLAVPLQQRYGAIPVIYRVQAVSLVVTLPGLLLGLGESTVSAKAVAALVVLGVGGTGFAYVAVSALSGRVGSTRSSVITYISAPVAMILGIIVRGDVVEPVQVFGGALTLVGAWFASRAEA